MSSNLYNVKYLLKEYGLKSRKFLGQNFLISRSVLKKTIDSANLKKNDTVLEIGPGLGIITWELAKRTRRVIAIEKDNVMVNILKKTIGRFPNVKLVSEDILKFNIEKEIKTPYKIVANIPFYLTSSLLRNLLEREHNPQLIVLIIQKEVAKKIVAKPPSMSILAVSVQLYAQPEIVGSISRDSFWPKPKVDAAIIKIVIDSKKSAAKDINEKEFFRLVKIGFSSPRKKLINNLAGGFRISKEKTSKILTKAGIDSEQRAQELSLKAWIDLYKVFKSYDIL